VFNDGVQITFFKGLQFGQNSADLHKNHSQYIPLSPSFSSPKHNTFQSIPDCCKTLRMQILFNQRKPPGFG